MLNNVLYGDLTGVFLVVGCTLFISLVNCLSEIPLLPKPFEGIGFEMHHPECSFKLDPAGEISIG